MINFEGLLKDVHQCTSYRSGDMITWVCPLCPGYKRELNWMTGEMKVTGRNEHRHTGGSDSEQNLEGLTKNLSEQ